MPFPIDYTAFLQTFGSSKFQTLWPAQLQVLETYATAFSTVADVAVELPTGAGKTLIALLIAEAWRQQGKKAAILSANKTLARQMLLEAQTLGIPAVLMEGKGTDIPSSDKRAYGRAVKIGIMNYWVYFNQNPVIDIADLLIMDDAHLAEHCLYSLFSVEIDRLEHESLFKTLATELQEHFPEYSVLSDAITDNDGSFAGAVELLSFIDQAKVANRFREIIDASPDLREEQGGLTDFGFRWSRLRDHFYEANVYMSPRSIWIRPYIYPLLSNLQYEQTQQRIYMSATVDDPEDLSRRLGVRKIAKILVPPKYAEKTSGRRLIVMNHMEEGDLPPRMEQAILAALEVHPKSVWLCSSQAEAKNYQEKVSEWLNSNGFIGHPTWLLTPLGEEIEQFKKTSQGHLFVAGRFDGMDFRANECRLVIMTTLPRAINPQEEFISAYLRDSGFMTRRLNQRIIQALGRCNRSDDDYGVYIFAHRRFASHFGIESNKKDLLRNVVAEIDMAQDCAEIEEKDLTGRIKSFLRGDFEQYDLELLSYQIDVPTASTSSTTPSAETSPTTPSDANDEVIGWAAMFASQNYALAATRFEKCWNKGRKANLIEMGAFHGWHWAKALYLQGMRFSDPAAHAKSLAVLEDAIARGGESPWFNRMRASLNRESRHLAQAEPGPSMDYAETLIRMFDDQLEELGTRGNQFERWCTKITELLGSERHGQYQEGLERLGKILGYRTTRPDHRAGTDCRWRGIFGNSREVVTFEAKIEHVPSNQIEPHDVGQAHNQFTRAMNEFGQQGYIIRATILTHLAAIDPSAESSAGEIKILEKAAVLTLWNQVRVLLSQYRAEWSLDDIAARKAAAQILRPKIPQTGWLVRALDGGDRFVGTDTLCAEWEI